MAARSPLLGRIPTGRINHGPLAALLAALEVETWRPPLPKAVALAVRSGQPV